ncbi:MAG: SPFH domain-containing protein, partial [Anaerolineae bacterium]
MIQIIGIAVVAALAFLLLIVWPAVKIVQQWERGVVLRFGRLISLRVPGLNLILPWIDRMVKVDLRVETLVLEPQE